MGSRLGTFPSFLARREVLVGIIVLMGQKVLVFIISKMLIQSVLSVVYSRFCVVLIPLSLSPVTIKGDGNKVQVE